MKKGLLVFNKVTKKKGLVKRFNDNLRIAWVVYTCLDTKIFFKFSGHKTNYEDITFSKKYDTKANPNK